jgi:aspartyl-tRNA(Asn)/glutamyl-tRNA(Gln) amidotransferase subunit A
MTEFAFTPAAELARLLRRRELSPVELLDGLLSRIERFNPRFNALITVCAEEARAAAREAERVLLRGEPTGPLCGVPFSVKDLLDTAGVKTTFGSVIFAEHVPPKDAVAVARLKAAGAILIGKTTTPEFGHKCMTEAPLFGRTANAWDLSRTAGGSSGGAAVAIAAGMGPLAVGTDGGGSGRIPAASNGVVGFKGTLGLVPHDMTADGFGNQSHILPMTRTVMDAALMLQAMAGPHPSDPHSLAQTPGDYVAAARPQGDLKGVRIAWRPYLGNSALAGEVMTLTEAALATLARLGAEVRIVDDDFETTEPYWLVLTQSFWNARLRCYVGEFGARMTPSLLRQMDEGARLGAAALEEAIFARTRIFREITGWFEDCDMVATPTLARTALRIDHDFFAPIEIDGELTDTVRKAWYPYTHPFNLSGNPAVSLPCGWADDGLPVGLQLVGPHGGDAALLRAASLFEMAQPWADRIPPLARD